MDAPPDTGDLQESVVVIPVHDEPPESLLLTLEALALQRGIEDMRWKLVLVINSAREADERVRRQNRETHDAVATLLVEPPTGVERAYPWAAILADRTIVVDAYSASHAPEQCNVGIARRLGAAVAVPLLAERGRMVCTDADTLLDPGHLAGARALWTEQPELAAATGPLSYRAETPEQERALQLQRLLTQVRASFRSAVPQTDPLPPNRRKVQLMSGCNIVVTKEAYEAAGGFPPVAGAEDTLLSAAIVRSGGRIVADPRLGVRTSARLSQRTHEAHGAGHKHLRAAAEADNPEGAPSWGPGHADWFEGVLTHIERATQGPTEHGWREHLRAFRTGTRMALDEDEITLLAERTALLPTDVSPRSNHYLLRELQYRAEARFAAVPLSSAIDLRRGQVRAQAEAEGMPGCVILLDAMEGNRAAVVAARGETERTPLERIADLSERLREAEQADRALEQERVLRAGIAMIAAEPARAPGDRTRAEGPALLTTVADALPHAVALRQLLRIAGPTPTADVAARIVAHRHTLGPAVDTLPTLRALVVETHAALYTARMTSRTGPRPNAVEAAILASIGLSEGMQQLCSAI